jgi:hypothetical protein
MEDLLLHIDRCFAPYYVHRTSEQTKTQLLGVYNHTMGHANEVGAGVSAKMM